MNSIRVLFFATLRDQAGTRTAEMQVQDGTTVRDLKERLVRDYPAMQKSIASALVAVNHEYSQDDAVIQDGAEVALFPPVSGG